MNLDDMSKLSEVYDNINMLLKEMIDNSIFENWIQQEDTNTEENRS